MVRERDINLIRDIIKLKYVDKKEKLDIAKQLSKKYDIDSATVYRNMEEADDIIKQNIEVLKILASADLDKREFKEDFEKIRKLLIV